MYNGKLSLLPLGAAAAKRYIYHAGAHVYIYASQNLVRGERPFCIAHAQAGIYGASLSLQIAIYLQLQPRLHNTKRAGAVPTTGTTTAAARLVKYVLEGPRACPNMYVYRRQHAHQNKTARFHTIHSEGHPQYGNMRQGGPAYSSQNGRHARPEAAPARN